MNDTTTNSRRSLGQLALALSIAGFLPIPGFVASIAGIVCGRVALRDATSDEDRSHARLATILGVIGIVLPMLFLFVYCVVLGYPFPLHRYRPDR